MTFTPFDPQRWPRREVFHYFSALAPTGYSLTVRLDVTALRRTLLPLSVTCHHAATDGWHVHLLLDELQALMDGFESVLV